MASLATIIDARVKHFMLPHIEIGVIHVCMPQYLTHECDWSLSYICMGGTNPLLLSESG